MSKRFAVEVATDQFHTVRADEMRVNAGAVEFWRQGTLQLVYAATSYITACDLNEDEPEPATHDAADLISVEPS